MARIRIYEDEADGDEFPRRCVLCGRETTERVVNTFSWVPGWVNILILAGLAPWLILTMILRKSMSIALPVCFKHRHHWRNRRMYVWLGLVLWLVYAAGLLAISGELSANLRFAGIGVLVFGVLAWLLGGLIYTNSGIQPGEITDRWAELIRVNAEFADEWQEIKPPPAPRHRRVIDQSWEDD